jgi:DNA-binding transcriptional regulator YhcF (GntR family)
MTRRPGPGFTAAGRSPPSPAPLFLALAGEYGVSAETAAKAVRLLRDEGLVVIVPSYGAVRRRARLTEVSFARERSPCDVTIRRCTVRRRNSRHT